MSESIKNLLSLDENGGLFYVDTTPNSIPASPKSDGSEEKKKPVDKLLTTFKTNGRYFEDPNPLIKCYNCNQYGHMSGTCPNPSYKFRCTYCGEQGHTAYSCSQVICHRCLGVGHKISQCRVDTRDKCEECGRVGHNYKTCLARSDYISSKSLPYLTCLFCRQTGHINCFPLKSYSQSLYCARCGDKGHTFSECRRKIK